MKKVLLYGVLPISIAATGYIIWKHRKPDITSVDFTGVEEKRYVTVVADKQTFQIKAGECLMIRGYSICLDEHTYSVYLTKDGSARIENWKFITN